MHWSNICNFRVSVIRACDQTLFKDSNSRFALPILRPNSELARPSLAKVLPKYASDVLIGKATPTGEMIVPWDLTGMTSHLDQFRLSPYERPASAMESMYA